MLSLQYTCFPTSNFPVCVLGKYMLAFLSTFWFVEPFNKVAQSFHDKFDNKYLYHVCFNSEFLPNKINTLELYKQKPLGLPQHICVREPSETSHVKINRMLQT